MRRRAGSLTIDRETKKWIKNASDERAAVAGMRFDVERAEFVCNWIENYCCLYEGSHAGEPLILLPWQREFVMRLFGWVRWSDEYGEWIRRFNKASLWAAKKNGKTPFIAAIGLYLLCADGEQGQKVFPSAKDGLQAQLAQQHAIAMVDQSPALRIDCKVNRSTLQITHLPTRSNQTILTGNNKRGQEAKEGINGSVLIDECHVFDRMMHERTSRAGISRKEPLNLSVSTAGDDPSSYGFERFQYGRQVNSGSRNDPHFLHVEYCAPDNITDADIDRRLEEFGKMANPSWGYIVMPSEFRSDWETCKGKPREVARFKQYRLNLWVGSTNPWLDVAGWDRGERDYTLAELAGRECYLGIDLSRTRDMTSVVFVFPWPEDGSESLRIWPLFWLPEAIASRRGHLFPFRTWADYGDLTLTNGDVVDYTEVEEDTIAIAEALSLNVVTIFFDQKYAEELTQRLASRLGCDRKAVPQTIMYLTALAKEFERRVSVGLIQHPGNKVMTWQVGHVQVYQDRNQNIAPKKPDPTTGKSIDGVAAALDAMAGIVGMAGVNDEPSITAL